MKFTREQSRYHKEPVYCDLLDELSGIQQTKIIADLFCISYSYLRWFTHVKPNPNYFGLPQMVILPVSLTSSVN
jgi:hypothetical protein